MTEPTLTDVYLQLGRLTAVVEGLTDRMSEAKSDRDKLAEKVETIADRTARLEDVVGKLEPTVNWLSGIKTKAKGGLAVILFVGGVAGYIAGFWLTELKMWIARIIFGH